MNVSVYAKFTLKNKPSEYRGITQVDYVFGKEKPSTLSQMCSDLCVMLGGFHEETGCLPLLDAADQLEIAAKKLVDLAATLKKENSTP